MLIQRIDIFNILLIVIALSSSCYAQIAKSTEAQQIETKPTESKKTESSDQIANSEKSQPNEKCDFSDFKTLDEKHQL